jgi:signal transduction histidine kinase
MRESYSDEVGDDAARAHELAAARAMVARLLPGADAALVVSALAAEAAQSAATQMVTDESVLDAGARELRRVRRVFALDASVRAAHHELNNPLTALLAEAQMLAAEPLAEEHRAAAARILELSRRIIAVTRRLHAAGGSVVG